MYIICEVFLLLPGFLVKAPMLSEKTTNLTTLFAIVNYAWNNVKLQLLVMDFSKVSPNCMGKVCFFSPHLHLRSLQVQENG